MSEKNRYRDLGRYIHRLCREAGGLACTGNRGLARSVWRERRHARYLPRACRQRYYIAIRSDPFWRQEPGLDLSHWTEAEWKKGLALYTAYNLETGVSDIADTIAIARTLDGASGQVGVMGFCLGGLMTFLSAAQGSADGAVAYYPGSTEKHLEQASAISIPLMVHLGEEDEFISKDAQRMIKGAFSGNTRTEIHSYPGCSHAFARHTGVHYDHTAAEIANERTWAFFDRELR